MDFNGWTIVRKLGEGGQGEVSLVTSPTRLKDKNQAIHQILAALEVSTALGQTGPDRQSAATGLANAIQTYARADAPSDLGALKVYKIPPGNDGKQERDRFAREVEALKAVQHSNLLRLIDADLAADWMITQFYEGSTLQDNQDLYKNRPIDALSAFRGLVEGVAKLHEAKAVHRDIKPPNIFVDHGRLVLGDFGIVFIEEGRQRRVTGTFERVGTRDWMPSWAHTGMRIDDVKPSFDVFSLGKVLWAMLSGRNMLPLWYYSKPPYNLETLFPDTPAMKLINDRILAACVVEEEPNCLADAGLLLQRVDEVIDAVRRDRQQVGDQMRCQFCVGGRYKLLWEKQNVPNRVFVLPPEPTTDNRLLEHQLTNDKNLLSVRAYRCDRCGNIAMFHFPEGSPLPAWGQSPVVNIKRV